jgi:branched-subunit amino acid aminotransferase/4-amino-4-deoxychorismate lyase
VDEVLRVGPGGALLEAGAANVFVVCDGVLKTPSGPGLRLGVTRALVLALARSQGLPTQEGAVTREDVLCAEEVFLTSSVRELVPVVRVDDHEVGDGRPGAVTRALHRGYRSRCPPSAHGAL